MSTGCRPVLFVGSVPLKPASAVFEKIGGITGELVDQIPDGEQRGWAEAIFPQLGKSDALELSRKVLMTSEGPFAKELPFYRVKPGRGPHDIHLGPYGIAEGALDSYRSFKEARTAGKIPANVRFQATLPGPLTTASLIELPIDQLLPVAEPPLEREIDAIVAGVPAEDLTVQLDLAIEVELEEYLRRPEAFDFPIAKEMKWTIDDVVGSCARLAARVPSAAHLGFHLCSIWHIYKGAGQDLQVHVDIANRLTEAVGRRIDYIHMPTIPEYQAADFAPLANLRLPTETKLYLGVIHASDGIAGAQRRIRDASLHRANFGVSHFCGLSQWGAKAETIEPMIDLHVRAASAER